MSKPRSAHVIEEKSQMGMFHVERRWRCRCGATFTHYSAAALREAFARHKEETP